MYCQVPIEINQQEDGLWRAEVPALKGCWVDASTLESALAQMPQVIAMVVDLYLEKGWSIPEEVSGTDSLPLRASPPVVLEEQEFHHTSETFTTHAHPPLF
jgi:predicted RNase H-like HicB family nuclease